MFEGMTKHTGILNNTGKQVVVVFMQLPDDTDNALVVDTDALPDMYNDSLRRIVESSEGQHAKELGYVLGRRMSPDGSNTTLLNRLHLSGKLMKTPITNVTMVPRKGVYWPLTEVLEAMQVEKSSLPPDFDDLDQETKAAVAASINKFNIHASNHDAETSENTKTKAANLIEMAMLLEADALAKREQAYRLDPSLAEKINARNNKRNQAAKPVAEPVAVTTAPLSESLPTPPKKPKGPPRRRAGTR
jgi:hypothetical protein